MKTNDFAFIEKLLILIADTDNHDDLWWRVDDGRLSFFINCNDVFYWGSADIEKVTPENLSALAQAYEDCGRHNYHGGILFCARVRRLRPQGAMYEHIEESLWPLFDAAGPEREIDLGNPYTQAHEYAYKPEKH